MDLKTTDRSSEEGIQLFSRRESLKRMATTAGGVALTMLLPNQSFAAVTPFSDSEIIVISDGALSLPIDFVLPASIDQNEVDNFLSSNKLPTDSVTPDCNITLWRQTEQDRLILFDVGAGANFMPSAGKLAENLAEAGIDATQITDVVFTHAHPDHLWGLLDDFDELAFPEATYHMHESEWDYWRAKDTLSKTPEEAKSFVVGAQNRFPLIEDNLSLFKIGQEVLPGIEAVDTRGHTPGHTSFALHEGSESLIVIGDAITNVEFSFKKPAWPTGSDQDQELGRVTRLKLLDRLAAEKSAVVGYHLPHPGLGRVESQGDHYRFVV